MKMSIDDDENVSGIEETENGGFLLLSLLRLMLPARLEPGLKANEKDDVDDEKEDEDERGTRQTKDKVTVSFESRMT